MMGAEEFVKCLLDTLRLHIARTNSPAEAARILEIGRTTVYQCLSGEVDVGIRRTFLRAQKLGLLPGPWIRETGLFPEQGTYAQRIRAALSLGQPEDPLLLDCERFIRQVKMAAPARTCLSEAILAIEDTHLQEPTAAADLARRCLVKKLRALRRAKRERAAIAPDDVLEFHSLMAAYGLCAHQRSAPRDWAWSIALALEYMQPYGDSQPLTWLLIDGSMVLRRLFKAEESLAWARTAASAALLQDLDRLYPRALLALASVLFARGEYQGAADIDQEVIDRRNANPYKPLAAFGAALALARVDAQGAAQLVSLHRKQLDELPSFRQMQRHWTEARVLAELQEVERAFEAFSTAISMGDENSDPRDFFLIFDEARLLIGAEDSRLKPIADKLPGFLARMSFQYPDEFYAAKKYLEYFASRNEKELKNQMAIISAEASDEMGEGP